MTPLEGRVVALERQVAILAELLGTTCAELDARIRRRLEREAANAPTRP